MSKALTLASIVVGLGPGVVLDVDDAARRISLDTLALSKLGYECQVGGQGAGQEWGPQRAMLGRRHPGAQHAGARLSGGRAGGSGMLPNPLQLPTAVCPVLVHLQSAFRLPYVSGGV